MRIFDLHCDTISAIQKTGEALFRNRCHFDIERALQAGLGLQVFALFAMPSGMDSVLRQILKQVQKYEAELLVNRDCLQPVLAYDDIILAERENKMACLLHLEGADALGQDTEILHVLYRLGLRSLGLTWNNRNLLADGVGEEPGAGGLSKKGKEIIGIMQSLGMLLDLSHISVRSFYDCLDLYERPVLVSHANARSLCRHRRNLDDAQLKALAQNRGVIGVNQVPDFIAEDGLPGLDDLLNHMAYIAELIGTEHLALGADFDGADALLMAGIEEYHRWPELLAGRGFTHPEIENILHGNALRVIRAVL